MQDVCIVGGGPAGLAAALALRKRRFDVTVVDCAIPPIDKACGEGLMPDSLAALKQLGVELEDGAGYPFRGIRFIDGASRVTGDFPNGPGIGVRRSYLHGVLVKYANAAQVRLIWGAKNVVLCEGGLSFQDQSQRSESIKTRLVVGADGLKSSVRHSAGLDAVKTEKQRYGFRRHYRVAPWSDYVELYWGRRGQFYVTPIAKNEICVVFVSRHPRLRLDAALEDFPFLLDRLANLEHCSREAGSLSISRSLKRIYKDGVALLGDASGSVDAITGEGMCLAFKQADALANALHACDLKQYAQRHQRIGSKPRMMARLMLAMELNGALQRRVLASLAKRPELFQTLLKFHIGDIGIAGLLSPQLLGFGKDVVTA
jgi:menaquinone-9 beta-reductase